MPEDQDRAILDAVQVGDPSDLTRLRRSSAAGFGGFQVALVLEHVVGHDVTFVSNIHLTSDILTNLTFSLFLS